MISGGFASPIAVEHIFTFFPELNHLPRDTKFKIYRETSMSSLNPIISVIWDEAGKRKRIEADLVEIDAWGNPIFENVRYKDY